MTFLFSDIEGSTQRWETHREAMKAAVARHEQLMSAAIEQHGGYVFKIMGDAFCAAFPTAPRALGAAIDAQLGLAKEDFSGVDGLRVRMGLHTGYAEERNADYFGPAINRVARLMSIGNGGQVLVSDATKALVHDDLPAEVTLIDLGLHRLKRKHDCAERALALYQSGGDGHGAARALLELGFGLYHMGHLEESSEAYARALPALRKFRDKRGEALCLNRQAHIYWYRGEIITGRELFAQALEAFKALGDEVGTALVLGNLAELEFADGHVEQALRLGGESLEIFARGKNTTNLASDYNNSAAYCIALGDVDGAREAAREGLRWARQAQWALGIATALQHFALLEALRGNVHSAARLIGYVDAQYKELEYEREVTEKWGYQKLMATLREQLSDPEIEKLAADGAAWSEDHAVEATLKV